jgi:hypothetical protein
MSDASSDSESWYCLSFREVQSLEKRRKVVSNHKAKQEYLLYVEKRPKHLRDPDEPMTPDPENPGSKRQWEASMQKWREWIRQWNDMHGDKGGQGEKTPIIQTSR